MSNKDISRKSELSRDLGLFQMVMMGTGMMIGAGIFVATGIAIGISGSGGVLIAYSLNGLLAFLSAMSYAELASVIPMAGGGYTYVQEAFGGIIGFMSGWISWFGHAISGSLYAITFAKYFTLLLQNFEDFNNIIEVNTFETITAVVIVLLFTGINYLGATKTGNASVYITLGQIGVMAIVVIGGIATVVMNPESLSNYSPFLPNGWSEILPAMGIIYIGFEGFEIIAQAGEEAKDPKKDIPKAIFYTMILVITLYLLIAFAIVIGANAGDMPVWKWFEQQGSTGFADAVRNLLPYGGIFVSLSAIFASTSALNATSYSSSRVSYAMGKNGNLPKIMGKVSKKHRTPHIAILISSVIIVIVATLLPVTDVAAGAGFMFLLLFLFVNMSVIKIRYERGAELEYGYLMPYFPYIPIAAIILQIVLSIWIFDVSRIAFIAGGIWIIMGIFLYFLYSRKRQHS